MIRELGRGSERRLSRATEHREIVEWVRRKMVGCMEGMEGRKDG